MFSECKDNTAIDFTQLFSEKKQGFFAKGLLPTNKD
jgi:hypothetical protein